MQTIILVTLIILYAVWWLMHKDKPPDPSHDPWRLIHIPSKPPPVPSSPPRPPRKPKWLEIYLPVILCSLLIVTVFIVPYYKSLAVISIFLITMLSIFFRPSRIVAMSFCEPRSWTRVLSS